MRVERESEEKTKKRKRKRKNEETDGRNRIASPDLEFNSHANHNEAAINTQKSSQHFTATETIKSTILICNVHLPSLFTTIHTVFLSLVASRIPVTDIDTSGLRLRAELLNNGYSQSS